MLFWSHLVPSGLDSIGCDGSDTALLCTRIRHHNAQTGDRVGGRVTVQSIINNLCKTVLQFEVRNIVLVFDGVSVDRSRHWSIILRPNGRGPDSLDEQDCRIPRRSLFPGRRLVRHSSPSRTARATTGLIATVWTVRIILVAYPTMLQLEDRGQPLADALPGTLRDQIFS